MFEFLKELMFEIKLQPSLKSKVVVAIFRLSTLYKSNRLYFLFHVLNILINEFILSVEIPSSTIIGKGLVIYHPHSIVIHGGYVIGDNLKLRQNTTIGSNKCGESITSKIGNNVDIGVGVIIIGDDITISDNVTIGAGSLINKSIDENSIVVGYSFRTI